MKYSIFGSRYRERPESQPAFKQPVWCNSEKYDVLEQELLHDFRVTPVSKDKQSLKFICDLLTDTSNASALHLKLISCDQYAEFYDEMKTALFSCTDNDEINFIVKKGDVPAAWLKINGFDGSGLWISMLVVHKNYRNIGVGLYALKYAEAFALSAGCKSIYINTSSDNKIALSLYRKAGYVVIKSADHQYEDNTHTVRYTLHKAIS